MTYTYQCEGCGHRFDVQQSIKAESVAQCPQCEETTRNRLITGGTGFLLRGGGWYSDSYSTKSKTDTE
jgi:putative FmdB family regulatory protein